jgi:ABC-2 type transport system permease protein
VSAVASSAPWLLRHELRLQWRGAGKKLPLAIVFGVLFVFLHLVAGLLAYACRFMPPVAPGALLMGVTFGLAFAFLMMVSGGIVVAVQTLYARGDMDLLLSSPLAPRTIVVVRGLAIAATLCGGMCVLVLPFANMLALFVTAKWLLAYAAIALLALLGTGLSLILAHGLFRLLGPRRARLFAQILGGLMAALVPLLGQIPNAMSATAKQQATNGLMALLNHGVGPDSWLWFPARAFTGDSLALLIVALVCAGTFVLATVGLSGALIDNSIAAAGTASVRAPTRAARAARFHTETRSVLRRKELKLITRDPWLITQLGQQMIFLVPLGLLLWQQGVAGVPAAWLLLIVVGGFLGSGLAWLAVSAENAPDLLDAAPIRPFDVLRAKLEAVLLIVGAVLLPPIALALRADAWLGLTLAVCCTGSVLTGALLQALYPSPGKRSEFNKRGSGRIGIGLAQLMLTIGWGLTGFLMLRHSLWALLPLLLLAPLPAAGKMFR